jgi:hypothetical protein
MKKLLLFSFFFALFIKINAQKDQVKNEKEYQHSRNNIAKILKAEIARQIWTEEGFYRTINPLDKELNAALKKLK